MTSRVAIATAHWRRLTGEGSDRCTLSQVEHGWILVGHAIWREDGVSSALTYDVRCSHDWQSLSADVCGEVRGAPMALRLLRKESVWHLNDQAYPATEGCFDLDLSFTPATNLMPVRRLMDAQNSQVKTIAAWLKPGFTELSPLEQTYTKLPAGKVGYASVGFAADLEIDVSGFVTDYPDGWRGWIDDA